METKEALLKKLSDYVFDMEDEEVVDVVKEYIACGYDLKEGMLRGLAIRLRPKRWAASSIMGMKRRAQGPKHISVRLRKSCWTCRRWTSGKEGYMKCSLPARRLEKKANM